ncbi:MAG: hypothetical protein NMNS01_11920 [Nitrosomonas sp.]|nr:MAG: hypothetical protein NMNS01_11920 [Nitrosomonas sp.]
MSNDNIMLKRLLEQEAALKQKIKDARKQEEKRKTQLQLKKAKLIGLAVLAEIKVNQVFNQSLQPVLERHIKNAQDRKMLGLPSLNTSENPAPINSNGPKEHQDKSVIPITEGSPRPENQKQESETRGFWKA